MGQCFYNSFILRFCKEKLSLNLLKILTFYILLLILVAWSNWKLCRPALKEGPKPALDFGKAGLEGLSRPGNPSTSLTLRVSYSPLTLCWLSDSVTQSVEIRTPEDRDVSKWCLEDYDIVILILTIRTVKMLIMTGIKLWKAGHHDIVIGPGRQGLPFVFLFAGEEYRYSWKN